jgi:signal transduction histidine kinase
MVQFQVRDNGLGIKESDKPKLFKLFGTMSNSQQQNSSGIGLGLVICKTIVEAYGGEISYESREREGSIFTFSFALDQPELEQFREELTNRVSSLRLP